MKYDPEKHCRRSIRLQGYDYSRPGAYFVTVCTRNRKCLFGEIIEGRMVLNDYGKVVAMAWDAIPRHFPDVEIDMFQIMPNHVHGIVVISAGRGTACRAPTMERFGKAVYGSLATIIRSFKSAVTKYINELRNTPGAKLWQRNYYDHIIRNEDELDRIRRYISDNPAKWKLDRENPCHDLRIVRTPSLIDDDQPWMT